MPERIIKDIEVAAWNAALAHGEKIDVCHTPHYHQLYARRVPSSRALLWQFEAAGNFLSYPFLLTPVSIESPNGQTHQTDYYDISSAYGYTGPVATTEDALFLKEAWDCFDDWAKRQNVIAEFTRFSIYADTKRFAHPSTEIIGNRKAVISCLPDVEDGFMQVLNSKTRNMIRKAMNSGLYVRELDINIEMPGFQQLYTQTMGRNGATSFFQYDAQYFSQLCGFPPGVVRLVGVFKHAELIAAALALVCDKMALYHLGASNLEYAKFGASNLAMYHLSCLLIRSGVQFFNLGGGRTVAEDDSLFRFKKSNGTEIVDYHIGKRVLSSDGYQVVRKMWEESHSSDLTSQKLIFYRLES